jgi:cytoskeletal protein CcmA (bactofilin family)
MFHRDGLFVKKEDELRKDVRTTPPNPHSTPTQGSARPPAQVDAPKPEAAPSPARTGETKGSKLIVGPDIKLKGAEITDCDTLVVEGRVEAAMDSRVMQIAEQGVFCGTAGIDIAEIHGRFEGDLTVRKHLVIHATGKVTGKIRYGKLAIEEGGELAGDIGSLTATDPLRRDRPLAAKPATGLV